MSVSVSLPVNVCSFVFVCLCVSLCVVVCVWVNISYVCYECFVRVYVCVFLCGYLNMQVYVCLSVRFVCLLLVCWCFCM